MRQRKTNWILCTNQKVKRQFLDPVKWIEQGEKPTKYFFNLEKKNYVTKTLLQIKLDNGEITSGHEKDK